MLTRAAQLGEQCGTVSALSIATHATRLLMREDLGWEALREKYCGQNDRAR